MDDMCDNPDVGGGGGLELPVDMEVAEDSGGGAGSETKKRKAEEMVERQSIDGEMKRVAEIVLVLAAMGRMRGGREPTVVEKTMMAEARAKVVAMCEELAPKDVVPVEAFGRMIDEIGLHRFKDRVGFRSSSKLSISEKIAFNKRRMEESKAFASQPASFPSQRVQTTSGAANENRATSPTVRAFSADKPSHVMATAGTFQPTTSTANVSSAASTPMRFHPPKTEVSTPVVSPVLLNNVKKDANSVVPPRHDRAHIRPDRPDERPNGPLPNVPVSSGVHQHTMRTTPVRLQPQPHPQVNVGTKTRGSQLSASFDSNVGAAQQMMSPAVAQMPGAVVHRTAPGAQPNMHHPVKNMQFVYAPQAVNHHLEISKLVQRLLAPKSSPRPVWTSPSKDYMNRAIVCQFCKLFISEVENMVVCDACEKGFHLGCLQSHNVKGLPRGEWHCPRCLSMSHGKPFPPKYGRVTRNTNPPKASNNTTGVQLSSEEKVGNVDKVSLPIAVSEKNQDSKSHMVNQPNATANRSQDLKLQSEASKVVEPSSESVIRHKHEIARNDISAGVHEVKPNLENCTNNATGTAVTVSLSTSIIPSATDRTSQVKLEKPSFEDRLTSETEPRTLVISEANSKPDDLPKSTYQNDVDQKVLDGVDTPLPQHSDSNGIAESHLCNDDGNLDAQRKVGNITRVNDQAEDPFEASTIDLHNVDWVGEVEQIVNEKKFFRSCRINGIVYQVHDYALLRSENGKLRPLNLRAMWEDSQTSTKWVAVHKCYFPDDLPKEVGRPGAPECNEVYESTHDSNVLAGFVQGPCEVLPFRKFGEEIETGDQDSQAKNRSQPVFIRNWFYDETRRAFCPSAS